MKARGIPNQGSTCYLNALVQALVGLPTLIENLGDNEISTSLKLFANEGVLKTEPFLRRLPSGSFDSHETLTIILDELPKDLFKITYRAVQKRDNEGKAIVDMSLFKDTSINFMIMYHCVGELDTILVPTIDYKMVERPTLLIVLKKVNGPLLEYKGYKLVSFIDFLGAHYITTSLRGNTFYTFNDMNVSLSDGAPTKNTVILFYEQD